MRKLAAVGVFLGVVAIICGPAARGAAAQTNSYTHMLNVIQNQNQSWYNQLNSYNQQFGGAGRSAVQPGHAQPQPGPASRAQYPITATDFYALPVRVMPDYIANGQAALTPEQKAVLRFAYATFLDDFERQYRRNNMAVALTYVVRVSLFAVHGQQLSKRKSISSPGTSTACWRPIRSSSSCRRTRSRFCTRA